MLERAGPAAGPLVTGFSGTRLKIDGAIWSGGVILTPEAAIDWDGHSLGAAAGITPPPEFILLGTGARLVRPDNALVADLDARGIGIEVMDSRAAARAWSVLRLEGRWISAALRPLD